MAGIGAFALVLALAAPALAHRLALRLSIPFRHPDLPPGAALPLMAEAGAAAIAPVAAAALVAGALAVLVQTGFLISTDALKPDLSRLSPAAGLRRLVGPDAAIEAIKALARLAALIAAPAQAPRHLPAAAAALTGRVLFAVLGVQAAVTVLDVLWMRLRHARGLRMSREELREEQKESEGDPKIKARIRQIRFQRARRRMLAAVPKATVVVTNPTHYAVALAYDRMRGAAPRIVAKGVDSMAARIRETALAHGVPLVANPPLARALHRLELDAEIPPEHYKAVAELIAYVWRL